MNKRSNQLTFISIVHSDRSDHPIVYFNRLLCGYSYPINSQSRINRVTRVLWDSGKYRLLDPIISEYGLRITYVNDSIK